MVWHVGAVFCGYRGYYNEAFAWLSEMRSKCSWIQGWFETKTLLWKSLNVLLGNLLQLLNSSAVRVLYMISVLKSSSSSILILDCNVNGRSILFIAMSFKFYLQRFEGEGVIEDGCVSPYLDILWKIVFRFLVENPNEKCKSFWSYLIIIFLIMTCLKNLDQFYLFFFIYFILLILIFTVLQVNTQLLTRRVQLFYSRKLKIMNT